MDTVAKLNDLGVGRGDRVAMILPNGPEMAVAFLAVASGMTGAPLNPAYSAREFNFYLSDLDARALLVSPDLGSPARRVAQVRGIPIIELSVWPQAKAGLFTLAGRQPSSAARGELAQPADVALVLHTSGTTSLPKMVPLTHANLCASARNICSAYALSQGDRCLNLMPLFHIHGLMAALLAAMAAGASVLCTPGFDPLRFFGWLESFRPTWYTAVPTMHQAVLAHAAAHADIIARCPLRFVRSCSAPLAPRAMAGLEQVFGVPALEAYGMTEAAHQMTSNPLPPAQRKPGSVGIPTGPEVAIMGPQGTLLAPGESGEIVIHGASVFAGYENNPEANAAAFADGWFRTGDQGYVDDDGYLFISGRIKEIINRGGHKVVPREIDEVLLEHPGVTQVVAFGVPHETLGEDVVAAAVLHPGTQVTGQELRELAFARLADFKVPSQILIVDEIPTGPTGKLQRLGLAKALALELSAEYTPPLDATEMVLARIWADVLHLEQVGVDDNFFALGGDSLRATQVVGRVRTALQVELLVSQVFREPTLAAQARLVKQIALRNSEAPSGEGAPQEP
jgi:acyl-CoA synthetase (AMP-forming)/AMP-acid ligase II